MDETRALRLQPFVVRKLLSEGIQLSDKDRALKALDRCVLGGQLCKAYMLIYWSAGND